MLKGLQAIRRMSSVNIACKSTPFQSWLTLTLWPKNVFSALRIKYKEKKDIFREDSIEKKEPLDLFGKWLSDASSTEEILEPNAMALATVNK